MPGIFLDYAQEGFAFNSISPETPYADVAAEACTKVMSPVFGVM